MQGHGAIDLSLKLVIVQGACTGPPPASVLKSAETAGAHPGKVDLSELKKGQCVISLDRKLSSEASESRLWLDNLFLVYRRQKDTTPRAQLVGPPSVYITNCTLQAETETSLRVDSAYIEGVPCPFNRHFLVEITRVLPDASNGCN
jgi:hypothetical protein